MSAAYTVMTLTEQAVLKGFSLGFYLCQQGSLACQDLEI